MFSSICTTSSRVGATTSARGTRRELSAARLRPDWRSRAVLCGCVNVCFDSASFIRIGRTNAAVFPVSLALYARAAPAALSATIIGIFYLHLFAANNLVGWIGGFLEKMPATHFWLLHAGLCGAAGIIFLVAGHFFGHLLAPGENDSTAQSDI